MPYIETFDDTGKQNLFCHSISKEYYEFLMSLSAKDREDAITEYLASWRSDNLKCVNVITAPPGSAITEPVRTNTGRYEVRE